MTGAPVTPRDASSVILVRHGQPVGEPWQCFMVRRPIRSEFAADVFVFPGGKVDEADFDPRLRAYVRGHPTPESSPEGEDTWRALRLAAVRELFEEAGVLLAGAGDGSLVKLSEDEPRFAQYRDGLQSGALSLVDLAEREKLQFALDRLHPFSRWITPEPLPRRYDTWFFVAYLPDHQEPLHDARETIDSLWIAPRQALERSDRGEFPLVFATRKHLERMAGFRSVEEMIAATGASDLEPVMPRIVERDGRQDFLLPGEEGY